MNNVFQQLNDSSMIISCIATLLKMKNKVSLDKVLQYYPTVFDYNNENKTIVNKYFIMDGSLEKQQAAVEKYVFNEMAVVLRNVS